MDFMDKEMSGTMDLRVRIEGNIKDPTILQKMDSLQNDIETNGQVTVTYSIANVVKQNAPGTVMDDSLKYETIPRESEKVNNLFTMYSMSGDEDFSSLIDYEQSSGFITALSKTMSTEDVFYLSALSRIILKRVLMHP